LCVYVCVRVHAGLFISMRVHICLKLFVHTPLSGSIVRAAHT